MPTLTTTPTCCDRMDNAAFVEDDRNKPPPTKPAMELQEVQVPVNNHTINLTSKEQCCKADLCQKLHKEYLSRVQQEQENRNPTDKIKTLFFISTLGLFVVWLVLYTTMSKFQLF